MAEDALIKIVNEALDRSNRQNLRPDLTDEQIKRLKEILSCNSLLKLRRLKIQKGDSELISEARQKFREYDQRKNELFDRMADLFNALYKAKTISTSEEGEFL